LCADSASQKPETRNQKPEIRNQKPEGNPKPEIRKKQTAPEVHPVHAAENRFAKNGPQAHEGRGPPDFQKRSASLHSDFWFGISFGFPVSDFGFLVSGF
jgi:hypothetical protein